MTEQKKCGSCRLFELLKKDGYGKCHHSLANWPNEEGFSATYKDNPPAIVIDQSPEGKSIYCHKPKEANNE